MSRFLPVNIHSRNIGSNAGLAKILANLRDFHLEPPLHRRYHVMVADVNIYERQLKVHDFAPD